MIVAIVLVDAERCSQEDEGPFRHHRRTPLRHYQRHDAGARHQSGKQCKLASRRALILKHTYRNSTHRSCLLFSCLSSTTISASQSFTNGAGFYLAAGKEVVSDMRKIVLKDKETGEFIDNFSSTKGKGIV